MNQNHHQFHKLFLIHLGTILLITTTKVISGEPTQFVGDGEDDSSSTAKCGNIRGCNLLNLYPDMAPNHESTTFITFGFFMVTLFCPLIGYLCVKICVRK
uniref:Uncharacterized protein n=1 Tax=Leptocylindrus danicus TaxID=163516 RepID=A0A7S2KDW3_9STRA|mmetsp:Transcript_20929/g.31227  ORF Transcript_20929/g.31227 Transcript_20929/m.31227 type:complete len:100 (+) Transcript_20929:51-350(+)